jgi:hypothetical protein
MVANASTLSTGTIFQFPDLKTSSSAGEFAGSNELKPNSSSGALQEVKNRCEES